MARLSQFGGRRPAYPRPLLRNQDLAVLPPDITTTLRAPVYSELSPPSGIIPGVVVAANLLLTLLAPTSAPFNQEVWASPQPAVTRIAEVAPPNTLLSKLAPPFAQDDWPIQPKLARLREADAPVNLLPNLPPGSLPFALEDWPKPQPLAQVAHAIPANLFETLLAPTTAPFVKTDWPIQPKLAQLRAADAQRNLLLALPPGSLPFFLKDWPKPQRLPDRSDELFYLNLSIGTGAPFSQSDWPIPLKQTLLRPADATRNVLLTLPPGALPLNQDDWPRLQVLRQRSLAVDPPNLLETLFAPTAFPFIQNYWPIQPKLTILRPTDETVNTLPSLPPGRLAFSQTSWPIQPRHPVQRLADAPRNITINLPAPQVAAGGIKHKRKWRRT